MKINTKKIYVRIHRLMNPDRDMRITREERYLMIIVKKLLSIPETDLRMTPGMGKLYMRSDDRQIFVMIDVSNSVASVVNHRFGYDFKLSKRVMDYITDNFIEEVEKQRMQMESEYMANIQYSLANVIHNLEKQNSF